MLPGIKPFRAASNSSRSIPPPEPESARSFASDTEPDPIESEFPESELLPSSGLETHILWMNGVVVVFTNSEGLVFSMAVSRSIILSPIIQLTLVEPVGFS